MLSLRFLLCALALLLVSPASLRSATPPAAYAPALWQVEQPRTGARARLFGTIHMLPHGSSWLKPHIVEALDSADLVVLEAPLPDGPAAVVPIIERLARLPAPRPVASRLPAGWRAAYARATTRLQAGNLDPYASWFVALALANLQAGADGLDPRIGADAVLSERARMRGTPIRTLESIEQQLGYFASLSEADQQQMLIAVLTGLDDSPARSESLVADWLAGRTEALAAAMNAEFANVPMLGQMLVGDRNQRWAAWIDEELKKTPARTLFVAVGAGHLAGPHSLISELVRRGYKVTQMAPPPPAPKIRRKRR